MRILNLHLALFLFIQILGCQEIENKMPMEIDLNSAIEKVEIFGNETISTNLYERDMAISPNGDEIIYTLGDYKQQRRFLVQMRKSQGKWSNAEIMNISGVYHDIEPFFADNGRKLYFSSNRPMVEGSERKDYNIWYCSRSGSGMEWGEAIPMNDKINTTSDEFYPTLSDNGNLYFTSTRENGVGKEDIFVSKNIHGEYQIPIVLDSSINTIHFEFNSYINPEENLLIFSSYGRLDGFGGGDLYYSKKDENGKWSEAKNMGGHINSDKLDYCPFIDVERNVFYFTSERHQKNMEAINTIQKLKYFSGNTQNGMGDIYRIRIENLEIN